MLRFDSLLLFLTLAVWSFVYHASLGVEYTRLKYLMLCDFFLFDLNIGKIL